MCMEDVRIGRKTYTRTSIVTLQNGAQTELVGFSRNRVALSISSTEVTAPPAATSIVCPVGGNPTGDAGFAVSGDIPPLLFRIEDYGDVVTMRWLGSGVGGDRNVLVVESFLDME